jgi:hypothetical protein
VINLESDKSKEKVIEPGLKLHPIVDRAMVIAYLSRLSEDEAMIVLQEARHLRNGVWKPLKETKVYTHKVDKKGIPRKILHKKKETDLR